MKKLLFILMATAAISSCNLMRNAQAYIVKHCPKTVFTNPLTGSVEVHYLCDSLWYSPQLNSKCQTVDFCIDATNGQISGNVVCDSLVDVKKLLRTLK